MFDVITVGSATVDVFVDTSNRLLKEEDCCLSIPFGAKILVDGIHFDTGGGGTNTACALAKLGLKTAMIGKVGDDHNSEMILRHLKGFGCDTSLLVRGNGPSDYSVILDASGRDRTILTSKQMNDQLYPDDLDLSKIRTRWFYFCTMLGDSLKTQATLLDYALENGVSVIYNPSSYIINRKPEGFLRIVSSVQILILNKEEAMLLAGIDKMVETAKKILSMGPSVVVITDGASGAYAFSKEAGYQILPNEVKVVENTGAGDSFGAAFLVGYLSTGDLKIGLEFGATEAESVIQHLGAKNRLLSREEVENKIRENPHQIVTI